MASSKDAREWIAGFSGIKVFLEGFRVLPYGEKGNNWLSHDLTLHRSKQKTKSMRESESDLPEDPEVGLNVLPNRNYFGAVFLTQPNASSLKMLVNREGFLPDSAFDILVRLVRQGIDLSTRVRAAARHEDRQRDVESGRSEPAESKDSSVSIAESARKASAVVRSARELMARGDYRGAQRAMEGTRISKSSSRSRNGSALSYQCYESWLLSGRRWQHSSMR